MKKLLTLLAIALLFAAPSYATLARIAGTGAYIDSMMILSPWILDDDSLIFYYPSEVLNYPNMVSAEYTGGGPFAIGYATVKSGPGVLGVVASTPILPAVMPELFYMMTGSAGLMYGAELGGVKTGASLFFKTSSDYTLQGATDLPLDKGGDKTLESMNIVSANLGAAFGRIDTSLAVNYVNLVEDDSQTYDAAGVLLNDYKSTVGGFEAKLSARAPFGGWITNAGFGISLLSGGSNDKTYTGGTLTNHDRDNGSYTSFSVNLGAAYRANFGTWLTVITGADFATYIMNMYSKEEELVSSTVLGEDTDTIIYGGAPLFVTAEGKLNDTWTARAGVKKAVVMFMSESVKTKDGTGTVDSQGSGTDVTMDSGFEVSAGVTATIYDFKLDMAVQSAGLLNGPYFLSGNTDDISYIVAVTYAWK